MRMAVRDRVNLYRRKPFLYVMALLLDDGKKKALLLPSCVQIDRIFSSGIKKLVEERYG